MNFWVNGKIALYYLWGKILFVIPETNQYDFLKVCFRK